MEIDPAKLVFDIICFLAPQGAGKDTHARLLTAKLPKEAVVEISMSGVLRHYRKKDAKFDALVERIMARGKLVGDAIVVERLLMYISEECVGKKLFILNGFPRSAAQAFGLWAIALRLIPSAPRIGVIQLMLETDKAFKRCIQRRAEMIQRKETPRDDDNPTEIRERLETYEDNLPGIIAALRLFAKIVEIDADQSIETVEKLVTEAVVGGNVETTEDCE